MIGSHKGDQLTKTELNLRTEETYTHVHSMIRGALDWGSRCHMALLRKPNITLSNLRNAHVALSNLRNACLMSLSF